MDIEAINKAIQGTRLEGRLTAEDLERWHKMTALLEVQDIESYS